MAAVSRVAMAPSSGSMAAKCRDVNPCLPGKLACKLADGQVSNDAGYCYELPPRAAACQMQS